MLIQQEEAIPRELIEKLLVASAPERADDLAEIWREYDPRFCISRDSKGVQLSANSERVLFDHKTMCVYWLLAFAGWRALECYCPAVLCSLPPSNLAHAFGLDEQLIAAMLPAAMTVADVLKLDRGISKVEQRLDEHLYLAHSMLRANALHDSDWPADIPRPGADRDTLANNSERAVFDLACISTAYAFCHELRHVMYAKKRNAPTSRPDEEIACDAWAREFLTAKLGVYAEREGLDYRKVLAKRSMAAAVGIFVLYETSDRYGDGGTEKYPAIADRMDATLRETRLGESDNLWVLYAAVLIAILRRRNKMPAVQALSPKRLCELLVDEIRRTS
jgi:hypothetical protein